MAEYRNFDSSKRSPVAMSRPSASVHQITPKKDSAAEIVLGTVALDILHAAALDARPNTARKAVQDVLALGLAPEDLFDHYIPAVARVLGDKWCSDELSFAGVTIGVSRLQTMLRELGANWSGDQPAPPFASTILVVVPQEIYHTLGAIVLSGQLRRKGHSVKLVLGGTPKEIAQQANAADYDAIFISSSRGETLESLRLIVDAINTSSRDMPPIVVGGTILEVETNETVRALTGANYATKIPQEALAFCGLKAAPRVNVLNGSGT